MELSKYKNPFGSLTFIGGPMFAGKTEKLKSYVSVHIAMRRNVLLISSILDTRVDCCSGILSNHNPDGSGVSSKVTQTKVSKLSELEDKYILEYEVIAIDESQFFDDIENTVI